MKRPLTYIKRRNTTPQEYEVHELGRVVGIVYKTFRGWRICGEMFGDTYDSKVKAGNKLAEARSAVTR